MLLRNVSWETYECLLKDLENASSPRLTYDHGVLEIMSPHLEHEELNRTLAAIIEIALEESDQDFRRAGSTTFRREDLERGFEPDSCYYIQSVVKIGCKKRIDLRIDPPPDLVIEIDLTSDSLNKFPLLAALGVPEVWRYQETFEILVLEHNHYVQRATSLAIPVLSQRLVSEVLESSQSMKSPAWLRDIRRRIRALT